MNNIENLFVQLNKKGVKYLILRNWELFYDDLLVEGHNDIDLLCKNNRHKKLIIKTFNAKPVGDYYSGKYYFFFKNRRIYFDFRIVGDGYYCFKWEKEMIRSRIINEKNFYTLNASNYYFSLIYHSIIHKNTIAKNYIEVLNKLCPLNHIEKESLLSYLQNFMKEKKYRFSIPLDKYVGRFYSNYTIDSIKIKREFKTSLLSLKISIKKKIINLFCSH